MNAKQSAYAYTMLTVTEVTHVSNCTALLRCTAAEVDLRVFEFTKKSKIWSKYAIISNPTFFKNFNADTDVMTDSPSFVIAFSKPSAQRRHPHHHASQAHKD